VAQPAPVEMDFDTAIAHLRARQNFALAVPAGLVAALLGAVLWAAFVYITDYELGLIAVAVGALVGFAVREAGQGVDPKFGILGAACAALGWALGSVLTAVAMISKQADASMLDVVHRLGVDGCISATIQTGDALELLFLAIAVYEGWKFAFKYRLKQGG
jgi:hypothetical protein